MKRGSLKRLIRKIVRTAKLWLSEPQIKKTDFSKDQSAYDWLNSIAEEISDDLDFLQRPYYNWGLVHSAHLAKEIGIKRISAIELGVAGGNGLVALDRAAFRIESLLGVAIDVYGFDTGKGLPKPKDYRDLPNLYASGHYSMNEKVLQKRLKRAKLILGHVKETIPEFLHTEPAPIGFISFDLDLYTSTMDALALLETKPEGLLPRIQCYLDDITGFTFAEFNGERLAIAEFNEKHQFRKVSPIYGARFYVPKRFINAVWTEKLYMAHILNHPLYDVSDGLVKNPHMDLIK